MSYYAPGEPMPTSWKDKPANRRAWQRLQNSTAFLTAAQQRAGGCLACHYCGLAPLRIVAWDDRTGQTAADKATVDHVVPRSRGGPDVEDNMVVSCGPCNKRKGDSMPW